MANDLFNVDDFLNNALKKEKLADLFDKKLADLKLNRTSVQTILDIPYRTLKGILEGSQKLVDVTNLVTLADFLQLPKEKVFQLYVDSLDKKYVTSNTSPQKIKFIKENFDLAVLKKAKLISNLNDFDHIEKRIISRLGYKTIFEYKQPEIDVAFSSGLFKPKNLLTRLFWIRAAIDELEEIDNPYEYNKDALLKFIPQILWHTMNEERGLIEVIKALFKIGITVIYQPPLQGLSLRGATFNSNGKPAIVLTNYRGFYSTLWFCLLHEIFHVVFDWEEIQNDCYHLTDDDVEELTVQEREREADSFASRYLFSAEKLRAISPRINDFIRVKEFANLNHVHHSIVYAAKAFELRDDNKAWARTKRYSPPIHEAIKDIEYPWESEMPIKEVVTEFKSTIYN